jgi:hypothetical protein
MDAIHNIARSTPPSDAPPRAHLSPTAQRLQHSRLLEAHEIVIGATRSAASNANEVGVFGTNDVLVSDVLRTNELQGSFLAEHLIGAPLVVTA